MGINGTYTTRDVINAVYRTVGLFDFDMRPAVAEELCMDSVNGVRRSWVEHMCEKKLAGICGTCRSLAQKDWCWERKFETHVQKKVKEDEKKIRASSKRQNKDKKMTRKERKQM